MTITINKTGERRVGGLHDSVLIHPFLVAHTSLHAYTNVQIFTYKVHMKEWLRFSAGRDCEWGKGMKVISRWGWAFREYIHTNALYPDSFVLSLRSFLYPSSNNTSINFPSFYLYTNVAYSLVLKYTRFVFFLFTISVLPATLDLSCPERDLTRGDKGSDLEGRRKQTVRSRARPRDVLLGNAWEKKRIRPFLLSPLRASLSAMIVSLSCSNAIFIHIHKCIRIAICTVLCREKTACRVSSHAKGRTDCPFLFGFALPKPFCFSVDIRAHQVFLFHSPFATLLSSFKGHFRFIL